MTSVDVNGKPVSGDQDVVSYTPVQSEIAGRIRPRQMGTGAMRGEQTVLAEDGSKVVLGNVKDNGGFGLSMLDPDGFLLYKQTGQTFFWYDKTTGNNFMQIGVLPDGSSGIVIAKSGSDVSDVVSD